MNHASILPGASYADAGNGVGPFIATPVGKPFFVKMVTDHYKKGNSGHPLIRRTVDSSLVQYLDIVQNVGDRLSDSDGPPCDPFFHKATNDGFI